MGATRGPKTGHCRSQGRRHVKKWVEVPRVEGVTIGPKEGACQDLRSQGGRHDNRS
jgi:hypothetical protein